MIFEAFVIPTPRRILRYFENSINEISNDMKKNSNMELNKLEESVEKNKINIEESDHSVKKLGFSIKIF